MSVRRTRSICTRVSNADYAKLERLAAGRPLGLWVQDLLLERIRFDARLAVPLAEGIALRRIVTTALFKLCRGERITPDQMQQIVDRADEDKLKLALQRLADLPELEP